MLLPPTGGGVAPMLVMPLNTGAAKNYFLALLSKQTGFWKARVQPCSGQAKVTVSLCLLALATWRF